MKRGTDETHSPELESWIESANDPATDFPPQNLPLGVFRPRGEQPRVGCAIGDRVLDLAVCAREGLLDGKAGPALAMAGDASLNRMMAHGPALRRALRENISKIVRSSADRRTRSARDLTRPAREVEMLLPAIVGDYSDFYASIHHATNVGSMFRPDNPLLPNYRYVPIGYHGRASSIIVSPSRVPRPSGQTRDDPNAEPRFGPSRRIDYEMEMGAFVGPGNDHGRPIAIGDARSHLWGLCIVNDWSARDIQSWEYQPLGPFLAKSFATSVSPWVVTPEALAPFEVPVASRAHGDPAPLDYLRSDAEQQRGAWDVTVEVWLRSARMIDSGAAAVRVSSGNLREMYWTLGQMITHHSSNGCNLRPGDLIATGTISGPTEESRGCLLERTWRGSKPIDLPTGEKRAFLEDGDEVTMRAFAAADGYRRIGFGECVGIISA